MPIQKSVAFLPVTVDYANGKKLTITESDLEAYPGMFVKGDGKKTALGVFAAYPSRMDYRPWRRMSYVAERSNGGIAKTEGKRSYPWRILAVSENDVDMPVNNLVYALASPNRIGDCCIISNISRRFRIGFTPLFCSNSLNKATLSKSPSLA